MKSKISPEPALLGFLQKGPIHGYDLFKQVNRELGPIWHIGLSQMYAILNDYAARGWIRTRVERGGARPARKVLELTPRGRKAFKAWMAQPAQGLREFRVDFFARLYFARAGGRHQIEILIDQQMAASRRELEVLRAGRTRDEDEFLRAVRRFRIEQLSTILKWLEHNRRELVPQTARRRSRKITKELP